MNRLRWFVVVLGSLLATSVHAQTPLETDEQTLRSHNMPTDGKGLLNFFQQRSMKDGDATHLEGLVRKLGSDVYREREPAAKELILRGPVSVPFLRSVLSNSPLEMKRRAEMCLRDIEATMLSEPISAAARVLALRNEPTAAAVLFNFLPSVSDDAFLEEEILACIGRLTVQADNVDPLILKALKDALPFRRNAAAYVLGRRGGVNHRAALREMLADADPLVRQRVAEGLFGKRPAQVLHEAVPQDETLLRGQKIETTDAVLVKYFRDHTLNDKDQARFRTLVKNMGSGAYPVREQATKQLIKEGPSVLAFLREAEFAANVELVRRAQRCIDDIRGNTNPAVPIAAAHLLTRPTSKKDAASPLIRTLLAYIPFVDDESVEEEILTCLTLLSLREPNIEPELLKALDDPSPLRRAAAAYVLGHVGAKDHVAKIKPLLDDANPVVRLRAAQGLLSARDKSALPSLVNLLLNVPPVYLPRVEDTLFRLSEDKGPNETISADSRQKAFQAWDKWLETNQARIDLASINDRDSFLGLITICEYDNRLNNINGQVWETNRGNAERWKFSGIMGAMDAHALPNGRVLVAENHANMVTERDVKGAVKWEFRTPNNPICCQRLPNRQHLHRLVQHGDGSDAEQDRSLPLYARPAVLHLQRP